VTVDIINLIPEDYAGDPHNALGYMWADYKNRVPGTDIVFPQGEALAEYDRIFAEYRCKYGEITVTEIDGYFESVDDQHIDIGAEYRVAVVHGMWCGSATRYIYKGIHRPVARKPSTSVLVDDGNIHYGEPTHGVNGYCRRCHSYCWGDCEANGG